MIITEGPIGQHLGGYVRGPGWIQARWSDDSAATALGQRSVNGRGKIIGRRLAYQRSIIDETINEQLGELSSLRV